MKRIDQGESPLNELDAAGAAANFRPDDLLADLSFELLDIDAVVILEGHARRPGPRALRTLKASVSNLGFVFPLVVDDRNRLIAGHLRLAVAKDLGMTRLSVVRVSGLTEAQLRLLRIADNKIPMLSSLDEAALRAECRIVIETDPDIDLTTVGFDVGELDILLDPAGDGAADPADDIPDVEDAPPVSRLGDEWRLGPNLIACGDARDPTLGQRLLTGGAATAAFIDPPYNVPVGGHVSGLGKKQHAEFAMASGEMAPEAFTRFLADGLTALAQACVDGAVIFACMDWRHMREILAAAEAAELTILNLCVWNKSNAGMGSLYRSQHELVFVLKKGTAPHINNVRLGAGGRYRTNCWHYPGANAFHRGRDQDLADHPTVKPTALVADAIKDVTARGDLVIDTFLGSGTTLIAAHRSGRRCIGVEIEPKFVDVAIRRFSALFPDIPITLAETGETFEAVRERRANEGGSPDLNDLDWNIL